VLYTLDLKNGKGKIVEGKVGTIDATFSILDDDLIAMTNGKLDPQSALMNGKMKIKGNMAKAMKFTPDILPKDAKL
jgi:putative sterol carrier protein